MRSISCSHTLYFLEVPQACTIKNKSAARSCASRSPMFSKTTKKKNKTICVYRLCGQFYTVSSCTKKARASIVLNIERVQYYLCCKSVKNCRSIGLNRAKKSKICAMSVLKKSLIVLCISDKMYKK